MTMSFTADNSAPTITTTTAAYVGNVWYPAPNTIYWPTEWPTVWTPTECSGDVHVFACEHATVCKCGACKREVSRRRCPSCGKKQ